MEVTDYTDFVTAAVGLFTDIPIILAVLGAGAVFAGAGVLLRKLKSLAR